MSRARETRKSPRKTVVTVGLLAGLTTAVAALAWPAAAGPADAKGTSQAAPANGPGVTNSSAPSGKVLWTPDIKAGPATFPSVQCAKGNFGVASDAVKGKVWRARQAGGQERCEVVGPTLKSGSTFYLGWSSKVDIRDSNSRYVFQLKCSPSSGTANHPIELDATNGRIRLQSWTYKHVAVPLWSAPVKNGEWHSYALKIHAGRTDGTIELWFDGVKQKFANGATKYTGTTYDGTSDYLKWGSYHPSTGDATNLFTSPRMATTLAAATAGS